ncbi:lecithin retinol acyltransferase family protein [Aeromonas sp. 600886]|uniref:lecithin retinol acyltransferase family protein n=1 Tax=Aeromonas sp. 600886 TaxID=2712033 RepID=UPI003BA17B09
MSVTPSNKPDSTSLCPVSYRAFCFLKGAEMQPGDHLVVSRWGYDHHGLYAGNNHVIHYTGPFSSEGPVTGQIIVSSLEIFTGNGDCYRREYSHRYYSPSESLARAYQRLGERAYNLQFNNCEHFVTWCIQGVHHSEQVDQAWSTVLLAITLAQTPLPPIRTTVPTFPALLPPLTNKLPTWLMPWRLR